MDSDRYYQLLMEDETEEENHGLFLGTLDGALLASAWQGLTIDEQELLANYHLIQSSELSKGTGPGF